MEGVDPVKTGEATTDQPRAQVPSYKNKSHPRAKFTEPLTPLHRLARFKEIRDRNLARDRNLRKIVQNKRHSLAHTFTMETVVNGVGRSETKLAKIKNVDKMSNGTDAPSHTNGVEHTSNGNSLNAEPVVDHQEGVAVDNVIENSEKSPKRNGTGEVAENVVDSGPVVNDTIQEEAVVSETVETGNEKDAGNDSGSEAGHESEGSSLDVVGESSSESLDLQLSRRSSEEISEIVASSSQIPELAPPPEPDQPRVVTPEIVRRIRAGGRIAARRNLRGEHSSPVLKRKLDDDDESPCGKKARDDGTTKSPGWQFFSPSKSFSKFWTPFRSSPKTSESSTDVDESMIVNVDEQSNICDKINEETATTLIEESQETRTQRWCAIM
uniref:Uncharacterized protein n=1 Tax=Lygus hesperus TaxID=30085 RepID=A0A146M4H2_LYGHE